MTNSLLLNMAIEIVDLPIKKWWIFPYSYVHVYQRVRAWIKQIDNGEFSLDCSQESVLFFLKKLTESTSHFFWGGN